MATFLLTAKSNMFLNQGNVITKGSVFEVNVNKFGVNESNVLLNSESNTLSIPKQKPFLFWIMTTKWLPHSSLPTPSVIKAL